jgi:hypothetical protein
MDLPKFRTTFVKGELRVEVHNIVSHISSLHEDCYPQAARSFVPVNTV